MTVDSGVPAWTLATCQWNPGEANTRARAPQLSAEMTRSQETRPETTGGDSMSCPGVVGLGAIPIPELGSEPHDHEDAPGIEPPVARRRQPARKLGGSEGGSSEEGEVAAATGVLRPE